MQGGSLTPRELVAHTSKESQSRYHPAVANKRLMANADGRCLGSCRFIIYIWANVPESLSLLYIV